MTHLCAICDICGEPVDGNIVSGHMDSHGLLLPQDWVLSAWPDGISVLFDPTFEDA